MKNKIKYLPISILTLTTAVSGVALSASSVAADSATASVTVSPACTFTSAASNTSNLTVYGGSTSNTESDGSKGQIIVSCNNPNGFELKMVGMAPTSASPEEMVEGATALYNSEADASIPTGTSGTSYWGVKVSQAVSSTSTTTNPDYDMTYGVVPSEPLMIVSFGETTSSTMIGLIRTDYQVHAAATQESGAYKGAVKYTILPN